MPGNLHGLPPAVQWSFRLQSGQFTKVVQEAIRVQFKEVLDVPLHGLSERPLRDLHLLNRKRLRRKLNIGLCRALVQEFFERTGTTFTTTPHKYNED